MALKKGHNPVKVTMSLGATKTMDKKKGWSYIIYQVGFSQFNLKKNNELL